MDLIAFLKLARPPNGLLMFFAVLVGVLFSEKKSMPTEAVLYSFLTSFGLTSSSMALNDYFDREVDAVNNPSRPIPSGRVSPTAAVIFAALTGFIGLISSYLTSMECLAVAIVAYAVSTSYNWSLKKTGFTGNLAVSFTVVAPFLYGSVLSDKTVGQRVLVLALLAFLANTGREIIKGMTDVEGDAVRNVNTIARRFGMVKAAQLGSAFYLAAVALSPLPYFLNVVGAQYLLAVSAADAGFVFSSVKMLRNPVPAEAKKQKNLTLLWMFLALISFVVGGLL